MISVAPLLRGSDVPEELRGDTYRADADWMSGGRSLIVAPGGDVLAGPLLEQEGILRRGRRRGRTLQRRQFGAVGHYSRPDVSCLSIDTTHREPVIFH